MTCELLVISRWRDDLASEECLRYLEEEHAPLVRDLLGLKQFTTSIPRNPRSIGVPFPDREGTDLLMRLQFDGEDELREAFSTDHGKRVLRDTENVIDVDRSVMTVIQEETLHYQDVPPIV